MKDKKKKLIMIIKQKGDCSHPFYITCNRNYCPLYNIRESTRIHCTRTIAYDAAKNMVMGMCTQEDLFDIFL